MKFEPINAIPDELKDGRQVLVLDEYNSYRVVRYSSEPYFDRVRGWQDDEESFVTPKLYAELPVL